MKQNYRTLEQTIGYRFKQRQLLETALTHPSFRYENPDTDQDNQRLEYLGDAVLCLTVADFLYKRHPFATEGEMSKLRSRLTSDRTLAKIGASIGIGEVLLMGRGESLSGGAERASNLADAMEAILGATWIDGGQNAVDKVFRKILLPMLESLKTLPAQQTNPKGELQEYAQQNGLDMPTYTLMNTEGPEHDRVFTMQVTLNAHSWSAQASSKREAERLAAEKAIQALTNADPE